MEPEVAEPAVRGPEAHDVGDPECDASDDAADVKLITIESDMPTTGMFTTSTFALLAAHFPAALFTGDVYHVVVPVMWVPHYFLPPFFRRVTGVDFSWRASTTASLTAFLLYVAAARSDFRSFGRRTALYRTLPLMTGASVPNILTLGTLGCGALTELYYKNPERTVDGALVGLSIFTASLLVVSSIVK